MSFASWLRTLRPAGTATRAACKHRRPPGRSAPRFRPRLEAMEDRCQPSGGVPDPTFGTGGLVTTTVGTYARAFAVATYPNVGTANDGKIVAAGDAYATIGRTSTEYMAVARYNLD